MSDCLFCQIVSKTEPATIVYETETVLVFPDIHPQAPLHYLIIPKTHYPYFMDVPDNILMEIFRAAKHTIERQNMPNYRFVNNGNSAAIIPHFHLHLLGRIGKSVVV